MAVLLSAVSVTLINFVPANDTVGFIAAACFTFTALLAVGYAGAMYAKRILSIRARRAVEYHDAYGPAMLCGALIASMLVNLVLRVRQL